MVWGLYHSFPVLSNSWGSPLARNRPSVVSRPFRICTRLGIQHPDGHLNELMLKKDGALGDEERGERKEQRSEDGVLMVRAIEGKTSFDQLLVLAIILWSGHDNNQQPRSPESRSHQWIDSFNDLPAMYTYSTRHSPTKPYLAISLGLALKLPNYAT